MPSGRSDEALRGAWQHPKGCGGHLRHAGPMAGPHPLQDNSGRMVAKS